MQRRLAYEKSDLRFQLPGNWRVTYDATNPGEPEVRTLFVESGGPQLVVIMRYRPTSEKSLEQFADEQLDAAVARLDDAVLIDAARGDSLRIEADVGGTRHEGIEHNFSAAAAGVRVALRRRTFRMETPSSVIFLIQQAPSAQWVTVEPAFRLIAESLSED